VKEDANEMKTGKMREVLVGTLAVAGVCGVLGLCRGAWAILAGRARPDSYAELVGMPEAELAKVDIGLMNLLCAEGLPGSENLDVAEDLSVLDKWAELVRQSERKYASQFDEDPRRYDFSRSKFKAVNLALTLKQDLRCEYNKKLLASGAMSDISSTRFFRNSRDLFLHGFVDVRTGSCASLPVLTVAVGRRCGYPLFLVSCRGHLFCRWDDGKERFNIETACRGADSRPDSDYRRWPCPFPDEELETEKYLKSLSSSEELGMFAQTRAICLQENQRIEEAIEAYKIALRSFPKSKFIRSYLKRCEEGDVP